MRGAPTGRTLVVTLWGAEQDGKGACKAASIFSEEEITACLTAYQTACEGSPPAESLFGQRVRETYIPS